MRVIPSHNPNRGILAAVDIIATIADILVAFYGWRPDGLSHRERKIFDDDVTGDLFLDSDDRSMLLEGVAAKAGGGKDERDDSSTR